MQPVDGLGAGFDQVLAVFHHGAQGGDGSVDRGGVQWVAGTSVALIPSSCSRWVSGRPGQLRLRKPGRSSVGRTASAAGSLVG